MDSIIQLIKDNFVLIILFIVVVVMIRAITQKLLPIIGGIFAMSLLFYAFTGDATFLNKTVDGSTQVVDSIKSEVGSFEFNRTSKTTFEVKSKSMLVIGNETTKMATVSTGNKVVEIPLDALYKLMPKDVQSEIKL